MDAAGTALADSKLSARWLMLGAKQASPVRHSSGVLNHLCDCTTPRVDAVVLMWYRPRTRLTKKAYGPTMKIDPSNSRQRRCGSWSPSQCFRTCALLLHLKDPPQVLERSRSCSPTVPPPHVSGVSTPSPRLPLSSNRVLVFALASPTHVS